MALDLKFADFQIHSPRDPKYKGWSEENMTLEGLYKWAEALLDECLKRNIDVIAVTDHHDLWPGLITLEVSKQKKFSDIWVFPGMEITAYEGIQAILVMDPSEFEDEASKTEQIQAKIFSVLGTVILAEGNSSKNLSFTAFQDLQGLLNQNPNQRSKIFKAPKVERLENSIENIAKNMEKQFPDKFLLLPNIEKSGHGLFGAKAGRSIYVNAGDWFVTLDNLTPREYLMANSNRENSKSMWT